jgi:hypothetical protein
MEKQKKKIGEDYDTIFSNILTNKIPQTVENKNDIRDININPLTGSSTMHKSKK